MSINTPFCSYFKGEQGCDKCVGSTGYVSEGYSAHYNCNCQPAAPKYGKDDWVKEVARNITFEPQGRIASEFQSVPVHNDLNEISTFEISVHAEVQGTEPEHAIFRGSHDFYIDRVFSEDVEFPPLKSAALKVIVEHEFIVATANIFHVFPDNSEAFAGVLSETFEVVYPGEAEVVIIHEA